MENLILAAELASLAEAAYVDLSTTGHLETALKMGDLPDKLANQIAAKWEVKAVAGSEFTSGYSSTLFKSKGSDDTYVFAVRGTDDLDDISTDLGDIAFDGLPLYQLIDMYNTWQRYTHGQGENRLYTSYSVKFI